MSFKTDYNTQSFVYFYSIHPLISLKSEEPSSRKLARYDFSKLNMTESISIEQVNKEIVMVQQDFKLYVNDYEKSTKRLEKFLKILNFDNGVDKHFDEEISL
ncbi:relaxase [Streptococcus dysgalactiae]|uniref:Conjugative relaxase-related protein n=1 Tax=Streptococcus dysgalactiae subsp. equisimilis TaxID=119602 RepID=A0AB38Y3T5_STREQ|nr:relaxase [Streptococcus dysgalactiae]WHM80002.1 conjugative relaxase-related protein [Streptococcus dysgalactiae subsp. equisimilis]WJD53037.1 conjugative relaxase-related protein [Streptococcus dysgalactiae subsp. equisimilis]BAM60970.1 relaxase [Streptococcus dysgalactiae subsp. equisimilis RE378]